MSHRSREDAVPQRAQDIWTAAIHEAAHAVAYEAFGGTADPPWAYIRLAYGPAGWGGGTKGQDRLSDMHAAIQYMAGLTAECRLQGVDGAQAVSLLIDHWLPQDGSHDGYNALLEIRYELQDRFPDAPNPLDTDPNLSYCELPEDQLCALKKAIAGALELVESRANRINSLAQALVEKAKAETDPKEVCLLWTEAPPLKAT